jgi:hypothetical protein
MEIWEFVAWNVICYSSMIFFEISGDIKIFSPVAVSFLFATSFRYRIIPVYVSFHTLHKTTKGSNGDFFFLVLDGDFK